MPIEYQKGENPTIMYNKQFTPILEGSSITKELVSVQGNLAMCYNQYKRHKRREKMLYHKQKKKDNLENGIIRDTTYG